MGVTFTTNIGLAKPDETELASNWVNGSDLVEDNNLIIIDKTDVNLVSYTPTLVGQTTPFAIGSTGTITGEYMDCQGVIWGRFKIVFGDPGVGAGSGEFGISLPFPVDGAFHNVGSALNAAVGTFSCVGDAYIRDASVVNNCGTVALDAVTIAGVSYCRLVTEAYVGKTTGVMSSGQPFTIATTDSIAGNFFYKRA